MNISIREVIVNDKWGRVTRASYKKAAGDYQHCFTEKKDWQIEERVRFAKLVQKNTNIARPPIIDLGCGDGKDLEIFWNVGLLPVGLDYAEEMLKIAKKRCPYALTLQGDLRKPLTFIPDKVFQGAWSCSALPHIPRSELPGLFEEVKRILVDRGVFYLSVRSGEPGLYKIPYLDVEVYREKYTEEELCFYLEEVGFSILDSQTTMTKTDLYPTIFGQKGKDIRPAVLSSD